MFSKNRLQPWLLSGALMLAAAIFPGRASAEMLPIENDTARLDTDGHEIMAQGGSILKLGETYYWYGFEGDPPLPKSGISLYRTVRCYSSKDLSRWKFEGVIFDEKGKVPNRLDVVYSPAIKKFVMISKHMDAKKGVGISTCDTPNGKFTWQGWAELPDSMGGGDQSVFIDDDGKGYIVYTPWTPDPAGGKPRVNKDMVCAELAPDFLSVTRVVCKMLDANLEAPAIFKRDGKYYWMGSRVAWWYSSQTSWCMASSLEGPWTPWKPLQAKRPPSDPMAQQILRDTYNSQHDFVLPVKGSGGEFYLYCGDRYSNYTTYGVGRTVWLPLEFSGDVPVMDWYRVWYMDAAKGVWSSKKE